MDEDEDGDDKDTGMGVDCLVDYDLSSKQSEISLLPVPVFRGPADLSI